MLFLSSTVQVVELSVQKYLEKMLVTIVIGTLLLIPFCFYIYLKRIQGYWARKNVPYIEPTSIWGNIENPFRQRHGVKYAIKEAYTEFKRRGVPHGGLYLFMQAAYLPVDPNLLRNILAKDFDHFYGHGHPSDEKNDPLSAHLFNLDGDPWRNIRVKLTPNFTSGKMKMMFNTLLKCAAPLMNRIDELIEMDEVLDIKEMLSCFTTDVIGSCAFGLECNSFKEPDAEFRKYGRMVVGVTPRNKIYNFVKFVIPAISKVIHVRRVTVELQNFFMKVIKDVMDFRRTNKVIRNDFVQLFLQMEEKAKTNDEKSFTLEQIAAQAYVFYLAGFETSATTMSFCLHELAFNQDIQDRLRKEVRETLKKYDGRLMFEAVMEMKYLDCVINETLRKYPPLPFMNRVCTKKYAVPNTDVILEKGTPVVISTFGLHRDEEYYPNAGKFDPERFTEENKKKRPPFTFIPFGEGPRICIGMRFGLMQTKTGVALLINKYKFLPAQDEKYEFNLEPTSLILSKEGVISLNAVKLTE